ncbi:MAG TPA: hypothetical protein VLR93_00500 [Patescibacteria group bacterium]|nr:hypothetical protein [Patescibacteria group bacterium]
MNHIDRLYDVSRRQQEMIRDAAAERVNMANAKRSRRTGGWFDRLIGLQLQPAA